MSDLTEQQAEIIARARQNESQRVEIYAQAMEERIADLLPESFSNFDSEMQDPIEVCMTLGITERDADTLNERECRSLIRFIGAEADHQRRGRAHQEHEENEEE